MKRKLEEQATSNSKKVKKRDESKSLQLEYDQREEQIRKIHQVIKQHPTDQNEERYLNCVIQQQDDLITAIASFFAHTSKIRKKFRNHWEAENKRSLCSILPHLPSSNVPNFAYYHLIREFNNYPYTTKDILWTMLENDLRLTQAIQEDRLTSWDHRCTKEHTWYDLPPRQRPKVDYLKGRYQKKNAQKSIEEALRRFFMDNGTPHERKAQQVLLFLWRKEKSFPELQKLIIEVVSSDIDSPPGDCWWRSMIDLDIFLRKNQEHFLQLVWNLLKDQPEWEMAIHRDSFRKFTEESYQRDSYEQYL